MSNPDVRSLHKTGEHSWLPLCACHLQAIGKCQAMMPDLFWTLPAQLSDGFLSSTLKKKQP